MQRLVPYLIRRLAFLVPQLFVATVFAFLLVKLLPGDPAALVLGLAGATPDAVAAMRERLGLDQPLPVQYWKYISNVVTGDWGSSWYTREPVLSDLATRLPATLTLISLSLGISVTIGIVVGRIAAMRPSGIVNRILTWYGLAAGSIPDFWMGLLLIFVFFYVFGVLPAPLGQLSLTAAPVPERTNVAVIDAALAGNWGTFQNAVLHLILPVATLVLVYTAPILKITAATVDKVRHERFLVAARAHGIKESTIGWYLLRNSLPPIITTVGVIYVFLLGGAVLVETVFAWNGFGQYAVEAVLRKDFFPIQGFMLIAATFTMFIYLLVDICYAIIDPRVKL